MGNKITIEIILSNKGLGEISSGTSALTEQLSPRFICLSRKRTYRTHVEF